MDLFVCLNFNSTSTSTSTSTMDLFVCLNCGLELWTCLFVCMQCTKPTTKQTTKPKKQNKTKQDIHIPGARLRRAQSAALKSQAKLQPGDLVEANFDSQGQWYPGRIANVRESDGGGSGGPAEMLYDIDYDDGDSEQNKTADEVRPIPRYVWMYVCIYVGIVVGYCVVLYCIGWYGKTKKKAKREMQSLCIDQTMPQNHSLQL